MGGYSKRPYAGAWTLEEHLIRGSGPASYANDPWISTTPNLLVTQGFDRGFGVIRINLNKLPANTTVKQGWMIYPRSSRAYHYSIWQDEVSILKHIPANAIEIIKSK